MKHPFLKPINPCPCPDQGGEDPEIAQEDDDVGKKVSLTAEVGLFRAKEHDGERDVEAPHHPPVEEKPLLIIHQIRPQPDHDHPDSACDGGEKRDDVGGQSDESRGFIRLDMSARRCDVEFRDSPSAQPDGHRMGQFMPEDIDPRRPWQQVKADQPDAKPGAEPRDIGPKPCRGLHRQEENAQEKLPRGPNQGQERQTNYEFKNSAHLT